MLLADILRSHESLEGDRDMHTQCRGCRLLEHRGQWEPGTEVRSHGCYSQFCPIQRTALGKTLQSLRLTSSLPKNKNTNDRLMRLSGVLGE